MRGVFEGATVAIVGMAVTDFLQGAVTGFLPDLGGGGLVKIGVRLGLAYAVGAGAEKFGFGKYANLLAIGGAVGAAQDALRTFVGGGGLLFPSGQTAVLPPGRAMVPASMTGDDAGVNDIVYVDPNYGSLGEIVYAPNVPGLYQ